MFGLWFNLETLLMAKNEVFQAAEEKIAEALRNRATKLDLGCEWGAEVSEKLTELPECLREMHRKQKDQGGLC